MNKVEPIEESIERYVTELQDSRGGMIKCVPLGHVKMLAIYFAQQHVKAALEAAAENAVTSMPWSGHLHGTKNIDKGSILKSYPSELIK